MMIGPLLGMPISRGAFIYKLQIEGQLWPEGYLEQGVNISSEVNILLGWLSFGTIWPEGYLDPRGEYFQIPYSF